MPRMLSNSLLALLLIAGFPLLIISLMSPDLLSTKTSTSELTTDSVNLVKHLQYRIGSASDDNGYADYSGLSSMVHSRSDWQSTQGNVLQLYFSDQPVWLKIPLTPEWRSLRVLEVGSPLIDKVEVFWLHNGISSLGKQGDHGKSRQRRFMSPVFFLPDEATDGHLLIRIETASVISIPVQLWEVKAFYDNQQNGAIMTGGILGILMVMVLYNLGVWYSVKEKAYLLYVGYALNVAGYIACVTGFGYEYLWFFLSPVVNDNLYWIFAILSFMFAASFMDNFLQLKEHNRLAHITIKVILVAYVFLFLAFSVLPESRVSGVSYFLGALASVLAWTTGVREWVRGTPGAKFFTVAWTLLFAGTITYICMLMGLLPENLITRWIQAVGITAETVLLSFALGERVALLRAKARQATETSLALAQEVNKAHEDMILYQENIKQQLEHKVKLRTRDLEEARHQAENANMQKSRFLAAASHDIRQPLHALRLLMETFESNPSEKSRQSVTGAVEHLVLLFDTLFDLSKLDNELVQPALRKVNVNRWLRSIEEGFESLCTASGFEFEMDVPAERVWIETDTLMLHRILQILLDNGLKHSGGRKVVMRAVTSGTHMIISVEDDGVGIPECEKTLVFDEFYQIQNSRHSSVKGMGLGLSLAKRMSELLASPIQLRNGSMGGCRFQMTFDSVENDDSSFEKHAQNEALCGGSISILVVEDDARSSAALQQVIHSWGFECRAVESPRSALALLQSGWLPDIAIVDYSLDGTLSGYQLIDEIRALPGLSSLPVVAMSGNLEIPETPPENDFILLTKPVKPSVLRAAMQRLVVSKEYVPLC